MELKKFVLGVFAGTIAVFAWGMLFWGFNPVPYYTWGETVNRDDGAAGDAIRAHFPTQGTYYIPGMYNDNSPRQELYRKGPVAFIHVTDYDGREEMEPAVMVKGFCLNMMVVLLLALLLRHVAAALPRYSQRVWHVTLAGLAVTLLINGSDVVFWYMALPWMLVNAVYNASACLLIGLVLARFIRPEASE